MKPGVVIVVLLAQVIAVVELHRRENDRGYFSERLTNQSIIIWTLQTEPQPFVLSLSNHERLASHPSTGSG